MTDQQDDLKGITVQEMRAAVQASGELSGISGPLFLAEPSSPWQEYFLAEYAPQPHPIAAMMIVTRRGQDPREVVISWAEYEAEIESEREREWADGRRLKPMTIFGSEVERHAYRVVFADVLADLAPERERITVSSYTRPPQTYYVDTRERDWHSDLAECTTKAEVDALFEEARVAKALKSAELHEAFTRRLRDVLASPKPVEPVADAWEPKPTPAPSNVPTPAVVAAKAKPLTVKPVHKPRQPGQGPRRRGKR